MIRHVKLINGIEVEMTSEQIKQRIDSDQANNAEISMNNLMSLAKDLLEKYSLVVQRAYEAGVPFPQDWKEYGAILRLIANGEHPGPIPKQPDKYPDQQ